MFNVLAPITDDDFAFLAAAVAELSGIHLTPAKRDLMQTRLASRVNALGLTSYSEYRRKLQSSSKNDPEWQCLINAMTTNKTDFFREPAHFNFLLQTFLPEWNKKNPAKKLRVWSAACSTGEEPYTLSMVLEEFFGGVDRFEILASDIDTDVVQHSKNGVYPVNRLTEIPESFKKYVAIGTGDVKGWFKIRKAVASRINFQAKNLLHFPFSGIGTFDLIFCRNVFIYFKPEVIQQITSQFFEILTPDGYLCIGHSESIPETGSHWDHAGPSILKKKSSKTENRTSASKPLASDEKKHSAVPPKKPTVVASTTSKPSSATTASPARKKRVLIVDDSQTVQKLLTSIINKDPNLEVVGAITDPREVMASVEKLRPDVMTLDMNMPHKDGCQVLEEVIPKFALPTVMITALAKEEGNQVLRALELGAIDYIQKPSLGDLSAMQAFITEKIFTAASVRVRKRRIVAKNTAKKAAASANFSQVIAIGSSTGGTEALAEILSELPANIPPIVIVQHIPANFSRALAERLNSICSFEVKEAEDGDAVLAGRALIAPGGKHAEVVREGANLKVRILDTAPVNRHKPSVDVLFDSVAKHVGKSTIGVILTGMGNDGAKGLLKLRQLGCETIAQNEETCVVYGMPREAILLGAASAIEPLDKIAGALIKRFDTQALNKKRTA